MDFFVGWLIFCIVVGAVASSKNRSFFGWFLLSFFFSPLLMLILVLVFSPGGMKKCPKCAELVKEEANTCRFCQTDLAAAA